MCSSSPLDELFVFRRPWRCAALSALALSAALLAAALLAALIVLLAGGAPALGQDLPFVVYSVDDGLAQSVVRTLFQDSRGYLWLGTADSGVSRFDGSEFTTFSRDDGLPHDKVHALGEDAEGRVWIGTDGGVAVFDGLGFAPPDAAADLAGVAVQAIFRDRDGALWLGTAGRGVRRFAAGAWQSWHLGAEGEPSEEQDTVLCLFADAGGAVWAGTRRGAWQWSGDGFVRPAGAAAFQDAAVTAGFLDSQGRLWLGNEATGVAVAEGGKFRDLAGAGPGPDAPVLAIAEAAPREGGAGQIWLATRDGVWSGEGPAWRRLSDAQGLPTAFVLALLTDAAGDLWLGTYGGGAALLHDEAFVRFTTRHGLPNDRVMSIAQDGAGDLWVGLLEGGVARLQGDRFELFDTADGLSSNAVTSVLAARDGALWIATVGGGVNRFDGRTFSALRARDGLADDRVSHVYEDRDGALWFSTWRGATRFDGSSFTTFDAAAGVGADRVYSVFQDRDGAYWLATSGGGATRFDGATFTVFDEDDGLGSDRVYAARQDRWGRIWLATKGGLAVYDGTAIRNYTRRDGLASEQVYLLTFDSRGDLWAGTERGLDRLCFDDAGWLTEIVHYGPAQGFRGIETNQNAAFVDRDGRLWFGARGLERYDPAADRPPPAPPRAAITGVRLFYSETGWQRFAAGTSGWHRLPVDLVLPHDRNHLIFDFLAVAPGAGRDVRYQHRLRGLDRGWSPPGEHREAVYSSLPPGDYTFEVRAGAAAGGADGRGQARWSDEVAALRFRVRPPLWQTWWFLLAAAAAAGATALLLVRARTSQLVHRQAELAETVARQTAELRTSEERLRTLIDSTPDFVCFKDGEGRWLEAGASGLRLFGLEGVPWRGRTDAELGELSPFYRAALATCARTDELAWQREALSRTEERVPSSEGKELVFDTLKVPLFTAGGARRGLVVLGRDISERVAAESAIPRALETLRLNHARWQALGEALLVGVLLLGADGRILITNPAARRILEALGSDADAEEVLAFGPLTLDEVLARHRDERPVEVTVGGHRPRVFEARASPVVGGSGGEWVVALWEVTAVRETERKLEMRERLAAVGQLAAGIAHDFNNILQSVMLATEMSLEGPATKDPETAENLGVILQQARHAAGLVRQILDFARQSPTRLETLDLAAFVEEVATLLRRTLPKRVKWHLDLGHDPGAGGRRLLVAGDPTQLQQVLTNLVINAGSAMPAGGELRISLAEREWDADTPPPVAEMPAGRWVVLTVADTGTGMPPEVMERIFEPFFTTQDRSLGAGLGLAQVYGIVRQHQGFIDVESTPGEGSSFVVYLPAARSRERRRGASEPPELIESGGGEVVLLVEDDGAILASATRALAGLGYRVLAAADGAAALELFDQHAHEVSLVLSDVAMPGLNGPALARCLYERGSRAPVILMSGYAQPEAAPSEDEAALGIVGWLQKPFSREKLSEALLRVLRLQLERDDASL